MEMCLALSYFKDLESWKNFRKKLVMESKVWFYIFVKITYLILSTINFCEAVFSECRLSTSMSLLEMKGNFASQNKAGVRNAKAGTLNNWCLTNFCCSFSCHCPSGTMRL